jgi:hypothetical protein
MQSKTNPGVEFEVARMSFGRRLDLMREVRDISRQREFHHAGESDGDRMEAALTSMEIDFLYWRWGLQAVRGLQIDGEDATPVNVWTRGPEALTREILDAVKSESGLTDSERKN